MIRTSKLLYESCEDIKMGERSDIAEVIGALAVHVDARRWSELLALFATEVRVDYVSLFGGEAQSMKREELVGGWRKLLPGFTRTCHVIGTPAITLSGDTAQASACVVAWHFVKTPELAGRDPLLFPPLSEISLPKILAALPPPPLSP